MQTKTRHIRVGRGVAKGDDAFGTGRNAALQAWSEVGTDPVSAVLVFASVHYQLEELLAGIHSVTGETTLVGATTAGEICNGVHKKSVVLAALASPHIAVKTGVGKAVSENWQRAVDQALASPAIQPYFQPGDNAIWDRLSETGRSVFAVIFSPGNTRYADSRAWEIVEELRRGSLGRMPLFGGCAADDWAMRANYVFCGREVHPDSVLVAVFETSLQFGLAMAHGFIPSPRIATATRVSGHEVEELDGRPAAEVYAQMVGWPEQQLAGKHLTLTVGQPLGVADAYGQHTMNVASYFTPRRGIRLSQPVPKGTPLTFMEPESEEMIAAGRTALLKAMFRAGIDSPSIALVCSCALRSQILKDRTPEEVAGILHAVPGLPVVGFYAFGEQGLTDDSVGRHNNEVISVLLLGSELTPAAKAAMAVQRARSEFLTNISHEMRTPINGILGLTELTLDTDLTAEQRDYLTTLKSTAESLLATVTQVLDFSKIEAGKLEVESIEFDLREALGDALSAVTGAAQSKGLQLRCEIRPEVPDLLVGDSGRLAQVLGYLLNNAIRFTETGAITVAVEQQLQREGTPRLQFSVADTGIGIPPEKHHTIFDAFTQADGSTTRRYDGLGLGLTISRKMVEIMGGRMWVESASGQGSAFYFTLPCGPAIS